MTDSTLPLASFSTAANCAVRTSNTASPPGTLSNTGTIVTEATTGVEVVLLLLQPAIIAAAATGPTSSPFMHYSLPLWCRGSCCFSPRLSTLEPRVITGLLQALQQPARAHARLPLLIHLRPDLRGPLHQECGARGRRGCTTAGGVGPAPGVARAGAEFQHAQLLCRHRHLVRCERLQVVDAPLVVERRNVRPHQLHILLVLQLL